MDLPSQSAPGVVGEIWHRLLCPHKSCFLCEGNDESEIFGGYSYSLLGKKVLNWHILATRWIKYKNSNGLVTEYLKSVTI